GRVRKRGRRAQLRRQFRWGRAGYAGHDGVTGGLVGLGEVHVAVFDLAAGDGETAFAAHALTAQIGDVVAGGFERLEQRDPGVDGDGGAGVGELDSERLAGVQGADAEAFEVDSALRPAVAFGGRDDVVDERGGPADVEVGAERLGRQGIREYAEEVGAVGEDAGGVGEGGDVVEVCAAAGPVHVE